MTEADFFIDALYAWMALSLCTGIRLLATPAPYGRHAAPGKRRALSARAGWILMESPAVLTIALIFALAPPSTPMPWVFLGLWELHYVHRAWVFPWRLNAGARPMPAYVAALAGVFNVVNGYFNGRWLTTFGTYDTGWLADPRFGIGVALFLAGWAVNLHSDAILLRLRDTNSGYQIPHGGLFRWVSCPNYLGETLEWTGWAIATWSLAGAAFALWTLANLAPRALAHHRWYVKTFSAYPSERRAFFPGLI